MIKSGIKHGINGIKRHCKQFKIRKEPFNYTDVRLSRGEKELSSLNPKFVPVPKEIDTNEIITVCKKFKNQIRFRYLKGIGTFDNNAYKPDQIKTAILKEKQKLRCDMKCVIV